jgi:hypothetical protein
LGLKAQRPKSLHPQKLFDLERFHQSVKRDKSMRSIVTVANTQVNSQIQKTDYVARKWLDTPNFNDSHAQKRAWVREKKLQLGLRMSEPLVLEALAFLLDAVDGTGRPTIATLKKSKLLESYSTKAIINSIGRLAKKGAIEKVRGPRILKDGVWTSRNHYRLIGYEFKLPVKREESSISLNCINNNINTYHTDHPIYDDSVSLLPKKECKSVKIAMTNLQKSMRDWKIWDARQLIDRFGEQKCEKAYSLSRHARNPGGHMRCTLQNMEDNFVIPENSCATEVRSIEQEKKTALIDVAHEALKKQGIMYPSLTEGLSGREFYKRASEYGSQHTLMLNKLMARP